MTSRLRLAPALVLLAALVVRLAPWHYVYGGERVRLTGDSDPHYHVLRAERMSTGAPGAPWRDPSINWPRGADVPWPPLFDALIAGAARLSAGPFPERGSTAAAAAVVPVLFGLLLVWLVAALGRRLLGEGKGWVAAAFVAVLPVVSDLTVLGRADQHALEYAQSCAILLLFVRALGSERHAAAWGAAVGALAALAFWTWMGSAFHLIVPLLSAAAWYVAAPPGDRAARAGLTALAAGGLGGAAALAASLLVLGAPGALADGRTTGVGGLHVALLAAAGAFAALLRALDAHAAGGAARARAGRVALSAALPMALLLLVPPLRHGITGGLVALAAGNPWYESIEEFNPIVNVWAASLVDALRPVWLGNGLVHLAACAGAAVLARTWRREPERRPQVLTLAVALVVLVPLSLARRRFLPYALVPLALASEAGLRAIVAAAARLRAFPLAPRLAPAAVWAAALATAAPAVPELFPDVSSLTPAEEGALLWLADWPRRPHAEGVLASWPYGHLVQYYADRPVVATPFGTEGGVGAMEDVAAFWTATDGAAAEAVVARRRCGIVLLGGAVPDSLLAARLSGAPLPMTVEGTILGGRKLRDTEQFWRLVATRLYYDDGRATDGGPELTGLRLVFENPPTAPESSPDERRWKLFEAVAGARVEVLGARGPVRATVSLATNAGRSFDWTAERPIDPDGRARFRLPYASGDNGAVRGSAWTIYDGSRAARLVLHDDQVRDGATLRIDLSTTGPLGDQASAAARGAATDRSSSRSSASASSANSAR